MSKDVLLILRYLDKNADANDDEIINKVLEQKKKGVIVLPSNVSLVDYIKDEESEDAGEARDLRCGDCRWHIPSVVGYPYCLRATRTLGFALRMVDSSNKACKAFEPKGEQNND